MKNNKVFLGVVAAIAIVGFVVVAKFYKNEKTAELAKAPGLAESDLIKPHSPTIGDPSYPVKFVEFLDPECEACRMMDPIIKGLVKEFEGKIFYVVRYRTFHPHSLLAAVSLEEAREQGKYWECLSNLFYNLPEWGDHSTPKPENIKKLLVAQGVKEDTLEESKLMLKHKWKIDQDTADGDKLQVNATPTFFVNGKRQEDISYEALKAAIQAELR
ncbi:MAG: DsbA family protein [Pseudobdellovibrionaceae bacterium]